MPFWYARCTGNDIYASKLEAFAHGQKNGQSNAAIPNISQAEVVFRFSVTFPCRGYEEVIGEVLPVW